MTGLLGHARAGFRSELLGCANTQAEDTPEAEAYRLGRTYADAYRRTLVALLAPTWMRIERAERAVDIFAKDILDLRAAGHTTTQIAARLASGQMEAEYHVIQACRLNGSTGGPRAEGEAWRAAADILAKAWRQS